MISMGIKTYAWIPVNTTVFPIKTSSPGDEVFANLSPEGLTKPPKSGSILQFSRRQVMS